MSWIFFSIVILLVLFLVVSPFLNRAQAYSVFLANASKKTRKNLKDEKSTLILALKELDFDFETGKLSKEDYKNLRDKYEQRAVEVMKQLDVIETKWQETQKELDQKIKSKVQVLGWVVFFFITSIEAKELTGKLINATDQSAIVGQPVRLRVFRGDSEVFGAEVFSDKQGGYRFRDLKTDPSYSYVVSVDYFGVPYFNGPFQFDAKGAPLTKKDISIYASTKSLKSIQSAESVFLEVGRSDVIKVHYVLTLYNESPEAYTALLPDSEMFSIPLAKGGFKPEFSGFVQSLFEVDEKAPALVFKAPIYPTVKNNPYQIKFTYLLPYDRSSIELDFTSKIARRSFTLFVNQMSAKVESSLLSQDESLPYQGQLSQAFSGGPIAAGQAMKIKIKGLPRIQDKYHAGLFAGLFLVVGLCGYILISKRKRFKPTSEDLQAYTVDLLTDLEKRREGKAISESDYLYERENLKELYFELKQDHTDA